MFLCFRILQNFRHRFGDIAGINRLKLRAAAADERQDGKIPRQRGEEVKEIILRPEHDAGAQDRGFLKESAHCLLARRLAARIGRRRTGIGAERRHMDKMFRALIARQPRDARRRFHMQSLKIVAPAFVNDADKIDDGVRSADGVCDRRIAAHRAGDGHDFPDLACRFKHNRLFGIARRDADNDPFPRQPPYRMPPDKPAAAEDGELSDACHFFVTPVGCQHEHSEGIPCSNAWVIYQFSLLKWSDNLSKRTNNKYSRIFGGGQNERL